MSGENLHPPPFARSDLLRRAYEYALAAHGGPASRGSTDIAHPVMVAEILADAGFAEEVVAAALLHDVVEDTEREGDELFSAFPERVAELVEVMTEDDSIPEYHDRKAEHRSRVLGSGETPASVYLADKLARVRRFAEAGSAVDPDRLDHYRQTVEAFGEQRPDLPFLGELRAELPKLEPGGETLQRADPPEARGPTVG